MITILLIGALFTGAGIYTMENKKVYKSYPSVRCEKQGDDYVCYKNN